MGDFNKRNAASPREKEKHAKTDSMVSSFASLIKMTLDNGFNMSEKFFQMGRYFNESHLSEGKGIYKNRAFNGQNPYVSHEGFEEGSFDMFKSEEFLDYILQEGVNFDAIPKAEKLFQDFAENLITDIDILGDENFLRAVEKSTNKERKLVILGNHMSHFDAPVYKYLFEHLYERENIGYEQRKVRFLCGAYMYYNRVVRKYTPSFDTQFVFGGSDMEELKSFIDSFPKDNKKEFIRKLKNLKKLTRKSIASSPESEMLVVFPFAGRADSENGCKESIPPGMKEFLNDSHCVYLPVGIHGTKQMHDIESKLGIDFQVFYPQRVSVSFGEPFSGGSLNFGHSLSNIASEIKDISQQALRNNNLEESL